MQTGPVFNGGRRRTRRFVSALSVVVFTAYPAATVVSTSPSRPPEVSVQEQDGVYSVAARFQVPQPPAAALAVLKDYEQIPRFMPGVITSIVRQRSAERVVVEQEAVSRMMMFSKRVHLLLEVNEEGNTLRFRDSAYRSFAIYEGAWKLSQVEGQTAVLYELRAKPSFDVPRFLLKRLLTRDARTMIDRLRQEIAARHNSGFSAQGSPL